ncbi:hypothetical protein PVK06_021172 [Gossypium arboreum]|uniref:Uncharacterized protein n=1 Tax=Gossypium arboreum TaxID=29729 RepID=A0ABR0PPQ0_GOSAR|nr:hypothetical protein PVK06_021172 [Gossypium arboreum]
MITAPTGGKDTILLTTCIVMHVWWKVTIKDGKSQLDLVLEVIQHRARENVPVDKCVELETVEINEEVSYTVVEQQDLRVNCQPDIES